MRIEYLLFPLYLLLSFWIIPRTSFVRNSGLTVWQSRLLLAFKILSGMVSAYYFQQISTNLDYVGYNQEGKIQYELLLSDPKLFFTDFSVNIHTYGLGGLFESKDSFWAYLRFNLLFKLIAISDLVTNGNFYFNTAIFCSIVFFGHIAFYRIYTGIYKGHKLKILFACLFLPSLLLYTCCVHKDGIVFIAISMVSFIFYTFLKNPRATGFKAVLVFLASFGAIFLFRNYLCFALLPALLIALLIKLFPNRKRLVFLTSYSFFSLVFFLSGSGAFFFNLPAIIIKRKADFALLEGANTNIPMNVLYPTVKSFLLNLPQAINHFLFRPYLWEFSKPAVFFAAIELFFYQLIILAFIFCRKRPALLNSPFNFFGYALFINMILIIGYTIPNIGAIIRYRSIFWLLLLCPMLCNTDWQKLAVFIKRGLKIT